MDVLCSDKTGTLTLNKLSVDRGLIEIFAADLEKDDVVLFAARASRVENQDAIDAAMVGMLGDPKEAREGIEEVHFFPFNPVDKRTALTYIDLADGTWHRVSKGAPEQVQCHGLLILVYFLPTESLIVSMVCMIVDAGPLQLWR